MTETYKIISLYRDHQGTKGGILGYCIQKPDGWHFQPAVAGRLRSKRPWPSWEACIPRWAGHPDGTTSEVKTYTPRK